MSGESKAPVKGNETNQPLKSLGKYSIERKLGQGGMGTVYLARHTDLKKLVALKVLPQDKAKNPTLVKRFKAEAQAAAQLEHPNIVAVYDTGEADGYLYIAMEYVEGVDLFEQIKRGGVIPVKRSIEIMKQVASALQHASEQNIVHRDIKPSNLLLRHDGVVKITDLGLARSIDETLETNITRAGTTVGTVDYMAPEQARSSKAADIRSDIYSLGCTWYHMLTGEPPFPEGSLTNKLQAHAVKPFPDPHEKNSNIPEGLIAILQRMTAKKPNDRYQTPQELLDDLNHAKLTKAAFSKEIFSDLSDYDMHAVENFDSEESDFDDDEPRKKKRSSRNTESPIDDTEPLPVKSRKRSSSKSRVDREEDESEDEQQPQSRSSRRSKSDLEDDEVDEPSTAKRKRRSAEDDEIDVEQQSQSRSSRRPNSDPEDDEGDEPSSSKRKRRAVSDDDEESTSSRQNRTSSASEKSPKKSAKDSPKPLPPKRQVVNSGTDEPRQINLEPLKYLVAVVGLIAITAGLGWMIFGWSNQVDALIVPTQNKEIQVAEANPKIAKKPNSEPPSVTISNGDNSKPNAGERSVAEFDITKQTFPLWTLPDTPEPRDLETFTVGSGQGSATHFSNLDDALRAADKNGGLIRLVGNGPFMLSKIEIVNGKQLMITAVSPQDQPLIIFKPDDAGVYDGIKIKGGVLELRGIHFAIDRHADQTESPMTMIAVSEGDLLLRSCSFSSVGGDRHPATAVAFTSHTDSQTIPSAEPRLLFDRVTVRGNGLTGLMVNRSTADIVIQDSLFVTGTAPAIDLDGQLSSNLAEVAITKPRRMIRVVRSTFCARKLAIDLAAENSPKPPQTAIFFKDSICSAEGSGNTAALASTKHWPSTKSNTTGWLTNLSWTSDSSVYMGFDRLLDVDKTEFKVLSADNWYRVWGKRSESNQFQPILWQESILADAGTILPHEFDNSKLPYKDVKTAKGELPGCTVSRLSVPSEISPTRLFALNYRSKLPSIVEKPDFAANLRKVDLTKEDLGLIINRNDWQSGTLFEVSGTGIRPIVPAKIVGKSLRIVVRQVVGKPLKLQAKQDQKGKTDNLGLFNIENGTLDIQSAIIESTQTSKGTVTPWLVTAKNAGVILRGCQLNGPMEQEVEQHQGLIHWTTNAAFQPAIPTETPFLSINDCILMSNGTGIRTESSQGNIFIRNCVMAIRGQGIAIFPTFTADRPPLVIDLEHVSLSATNAAFRFEAAKVSNAVSSPVRIFVDYSALCPPLEFKAGEASEAAILECTGPARELKQIEWWGASNGVSKDVKTYLRESNSVSIHSPTDWIAAWGDSNELRLITGSSGVMMNNMLPNKWTSLKPISFALDPNSQGASWADGGRPIGADTRLIEDYISGKKTVKDFKPNTPSPPASQATSVPKPANKKDIGF